MPTGPKGAKRPRDTNQLAKLMVDIEVEDRERTPEERGVDQRVWQHLPQAVKMRNDFVHGNRVHPLEECDGKATTSFQR